MEPPDFEQIARESLDRWGGEEAPIQRSLIVEDLIEQLRQVWNARGAADLQAIEAALDFKGDTYADLHLSAQQDAITKLDQ
jgi:hypothetical protein